MDTTTLCVLDWQIRSILRLKNELKNAKQQKAQKMHQNIDHLYQSMDQLDPDKTKRLLLLFLYFKEHLRTANAKKRLHLLTHSLSDFVSSCGPQENTKDYLLRQLLGQKNIAQIIQNVALKNQPINKPAFLSPKKDLLCHD